MLQQIEGLDVQHGPESRSISLVVNQGRPLTFDVYSFPVLSWEKAEDITRTWHNPTSNSSGHHKLIATRHLGSATRELLREAGISWAEESTGICRLFAPGLLVDVRVERALHRQQTFRASLRDRSGLVAETLLLAFIHREIRLASLAKQSNVSPSLVSRVLSRLARLKLLDTHRAGPKRFWLLSNPGGILDLWATEEQPAPQTTGLYVWSRSPQELLGKLAHLNDLSKRWALAGPSAANLYAPTLTTFPDPTIWVDSRVPAREVARILGGEIAEKGANLQVWQTKHNVAFTKSTVWTQAAKTDLVLPELPIVSRPRAYIETVKGAGRSQEVAQNLRQGIISDGIS